MTLYFIDFDQDTDNGVIIKDLSIPFSNTTPLSCFVVSKFLVNQT